MNYRLEQVYRQIPRSTCPPGCGKCCTILFPSLAELRNIKEWLGRHHRPYLDFHMVVDLKCPYLGEDKRCTIYEVRPFLCRIMGASVDIPCSHAQPMKPEGLLNHAISSALYRAIYLTGKEKPRTECHQKILKEIIARAVSP